MFKSIFFSTVCIIIAIVAGSVVGSSTQLGTQLEGYIDYMIIALVLLVFIDTRVSKFGEAIKSAKVLTVMWVSNFVFIPILGFLLTKLCLSNHPLIALGVVIYFMAPCTDWFLGFTRMANGNTALGTILLPINMLTQLLLYPVYLSVFSLNSGVQVSAAEIGGNLLNWFLLPLLYAIAVKIVLHLSPKKIRAAVDNIGGSLINGMIYLLIFAIFCTHIDKISDNYAAFVVVLMTVLLFFAINTTTIDLIAKKLAFTHENHVLYSMTTTARNAPMMLGLTTAALPDQPMVYVAIILGMLIEFPFLAFQVSKLKRQALVVDNTERSLASLLSY